MKVKDFMKKGNLEEGNLIKIKTKEGNEFTGFIIPSDKEEMLALKSSQGYNAGFNVNNISEVKMLKESKKVGKPKTVNIEKNPDLPTISILHTGGTIASRVNYKTGGVFSSFSPEDLIALFPEIPKIANIDSILVSNIMSENMMFDNYKKIAKAVEEESRKDIKGIIIGHGTDTMHYTSAALSFMLENINIPVIIVGAQRSSDRGSSDAAMNLICAMEFIKKTDFAGVAVCMHENIGDDNCIVIPGTKARKMHSSRRDAFKAINARPIARIHAGTKEIEYLKEDYPKQNPGNELKTRYEFEEKVGLLKSHPNISHKIVEFFKGYKGLIIEGTGLGHLPVGTKENEKIEKALEKVIKSGTTVVMTTQTIYGRVDMGVYSVGRILMKKGVISGEDMLPETAFIKLAWLLGNYKKEEARELIGKSLRGEITACSEITNFEKIDSFKK